MLSSCASDEGSPERYSQVNTPFGWATQVEVNENKMDRNYKPQQQSMWCWAASMSIIFSYYGHPVSQERIVSDLFNGMEPDLPASNYIIFIRDLNRSWTDDNGQVFNVRIRGLYDAQDGVAKLPNSQVIAELAAQRPLLMCNTHHATVVSLLQYQGSSQYPHIIYGEVYDPLPQVGKRPFESGEYGPELTFLAAVLVTDSDNHEGIPSIANGAEFSESVKTLRTFIRESENEFESLKGEPVKTTIERAWESTVVYPSVASTSTIIHDRNGVIFIRIGLHEPNRKNALLRIELFRNALLATMPGWNETEIPLNNEDIKAEQSAGLKTMRQISFTREGNAEVLFPPRALLTSVENIDDHTFITSLSIYPGETK